MRTTNKDTLNLVQELATLCEVRKAAEKREKIIKEELREIMGNELLLEAGSFCVICESRNRLDLNKDALMHDLGREFIEKYSKRVSYETMIVRPIHFVGVSHG